MSDDQPGEVGPQDEPTEVTGPSADAPWSPPAAQPAAWPAAPPDGPPAVPPAAPPVGPAAAPPASAPATPGWAPPSGTPADEPTAAMPVPPQPPPYGAPTQQTPTYGAPYGSSTPGAPPPFGQPAGGPPSFGQPPQGPAPYGQPPQGQPPYGQQPPWGQQPQGQPPYGAIDPQPSGPAEAPRRNRALLFVALAVVALLAVGGVIAAVSVLGSGDSDLGLEIDSCEISASGTVTAAGTLRNDSGDRAEVDLEVTFRDVATDEAFATERIPLRVAGNSSERWNATAEASEEVQQVNCDVAARP